MSTPQLIIEEMIEHYENTLCDDETYDVIWVLQQALDRIKKETGWISVNERLPEENEKFPYSHFVMVFD